MYSANIICRLPVWILDINSVSEGSSAWIPAIYMPCNLRWHLPYLALVAVTEIVIQFCRFRRERNIDPRKCALNLPLDRCQYSKLLIRWIIVNYNAPHKKIRNHITSNFRHSSLCRLQWRSFLRYGIYCGSPRTTVHRSLETPHANSHF